MKGSFSKASIPKRMAIVVAGATVNIIFGLLVYFILMSTSSSTYITNEINSVIDGYAAQEIELQQGDKIIKLNGKNIKNKYDLDKVMKKNNGEEIELKIQRNEENLNII